MKRFLVVLLAGGILLPMAVAQSGQPGQRLLTNQDIVMLARAGFTEDVILAAIQAGKTHFDMSPAGLAELAKEGLNQRIVVAMANGGSTPVAAARPAAEQPPLPAAQPAAALCPEDMAIPGSEMRTRAQIVQPSRAGLAIAAQTPYYESTSVLFGLFRKKVGVGAVPHADQILSPQIGPGGGGNRMMANFPTLVAPAGSGVRYVVLP